VFCVYILYCIVFMLSVGKCVFSDSLSLLSMNTYADLYVVVSRSVLSMPVGGGCVVCLWKDQDHCSLWGRKVHSPSAMSSIMQVSSSRLLVIGTYLDF